MLLVCAAIIVAATLLVVDEIGVRIWGFKWHIHRFLHNDIGGGCAMCRLLRSFAAVGHGQISQAIQYHWLGVVMFAIVVCEIVYRSYAIIRHPKRISKKAGNLHVIALIFAMAAMVAAFVF